MPNYETVEEVLAHYNPKKYRTPDGYTSDIAVFAIVDERGEETNEELPPNLALKLMLIRRAVSNNEGEPNIEGGKWALPGGFVNANETAGEAALRELAEETGVEGIHVSHYGVYDKPGRDPRGWIITNAHYAIVPEEYLAKRKAADDAEDVAFFTIPEVKNLNLAFDHRNIIEDAVEQMKKDMILKAVMNSDLLDESILFELRDLIQAVLDDVLEINWNSKFLAFI